ncbi:MAG: hypothetical protein HC859_06395 [Bacteroidia bacterium]|nr:hypothetical protein [Bacteroidia bacterium]
MCGLLVACGGGSSQESATDSAQSDTLVPLETVVTPDSEDMPEDYPDEGVVAQAFDSVSQLMEAQRGNFFEVSVTTNQYEATSLVTIYYDQAASLRYFSESWSMEGTEGSSEYFVQDDQIVCARVIETIDGNDTSTSWCAATGGERTTINYDSGDPITEAVPSDFRNTCEEELDRYIRIFDDLLREGELIEDGDNYVLRVENEFEGDESIIEYTQVTLDKKLYQLLRR